MKISIIIPCYNGAKYIDKCIKSIENQYLNDISLELIFINDGSKDDSLEVINEINSKSRLDIKIYDSINRGLSATRNFGLEKSTGDYIWFVDVDDFIDEKSFTHFESILKRDNPDIIAFKAQNLIEDRNIIRNIFFKVKGLSDNETFFVKNKFDMCVPFFIFRREFLLKKQLRFYEGIFHEDFEFTPRAILASDSIYSLDKILYNVFFSENSITRSYNSKKAFDMLTVVVSLCKINSNNKLVKLKLYRLISMGMNNSLNNINGMNSEVFLKYKAEFKKYKLNSKYLIKSKKIKYILEGITLMISTDLFLNLFKFSKFLKNEK